MNPFTPAESGPQPKLEIDSKKYTFDRIAVGGSDTHEFTVKNMGEAPLKLAVGPRTCKCTIGKLATEDMGMPWALTMGEVLYCAEFVEYFAGWADKITGETIPLSAANTLDYTLREPQGVIAAIASGLGFYAISGIWRPFDPEGWDYLVHFGAWTIAYFPGFAALLVSRSS